MKDLSIKKLYYSISEVSKITNIEQYVLRYWETEFEELKPSKNRAGNRIYTNKDIKLLLQIKKLLRDEKYTIEGAKKIRRSIIVSLLVIVLFIPSVAISYAWKESDTISLTVAGIFIIAIIISGFNITFTKCPRCQNSYIFNLLTLKGQVKSMYPFLFGFKFMCS